jgi:hypothetical protein
MHVGEEGDKGHEAGGYFVGDFSLTFPEAKYVTNDPKGSVIFTSSLSACVFRWLFFAE